MPVTTADELAQTRTRLADARQRQEHLLAAAKQHRAESRVWHQRSLAIVPLEASGEQVEQYRGRADELARQADAEEAEARQLAEETIPALEELERRLAEQAAWERRQALVDEMDRLKVRELELVERIRAVNADLRRLYVEYARLLRRARQVAEALGVPRFTLGEPLPGADGYRWLPRQLRPPAWDPSAVPFTEQGSRERLERDISPEVEAEGGSLGGR